LPEAAAPAHIEDDSEGMSGGEMTEQQQIIARLPWNRDRYQERWDWRSDDAKLEDRRKEVEEEGRRERRIERDRELHQFDDEIAEGLRRGSDPNADPNAVSTADPNTVSNSASTDDLNAATASSMHGAGGGMQGEGDFGGTIFETFDMPEGDEGVDGDWEGGIDGGSDTSDDYDDPPAVPMTDHQRRCSKIALASPTPLSPPHPSPHSYSPFPLPFLSLPLSPSLFFSPSGSVH
jgi:hypothetical protein